MENRIERKTDESLYQPKVHSNRIKELYNLKQVTGLPMTVLLDQAIQDLAASYGANDSNGEEPILEQVDQETWEEIREYRNFLDQLEYQKCLEELDKITGSDSGRASMMTKDESVKREKELSQTIYKAK